MIYRDFIEETESNYLPFMQIIGDADRYCFGKDAKIYRWNHETWESEPMDKTFLELLDYELGEQEKRKDRKIELMNKSNV